MLSIALFLMTQMATPTETKSPDNLGEALFYASLEASGTKLCNRRQAARYRKEFDRRYGERIRTLISYHEREFGKDPDFIVTSSCRASLASIQQQDREHAQALDRFKLALQELEARYSPPKPRAPNGS